MTPRERSRFAADTANEEVARPLGPLGSAREFITNARDRLRTHAGWSDGLGDCLTDRKTCLSGMACLPVTSGQLVQRTFGIKKSCITISVILWLCALAHITTDWWEPACGVDADLNDDGRTMNGEVMDVLDANDDNVVTLNEVQNTQEAVYACQRLYYSSPLYVLMSFLGGSFVAATCLITMLLRARIRKRDNIPVTVCAGLDDCCCAIICTPCVQCQLLRHEGLGEGRYEFTSPDGEPNDNTGFAQL